MIALDPEPISASFTLMAQSGNNPQSWNTDIFEGVGEAKSKGAAHCATPHFRFSAV